jgi:Uma2 family endonuclease
MTVETKLLTYEEYLVLPELKPRGDITGDHLIEGTPDLVVETLSPSNARAQVKEKLDDYATIGVSQCWLVSAEAQTMEGLQPTDEGWARQEIYGRGDTMTSPLLPTFSLKVTEIFD